MSHKNLSAKIKIPRILKDKLNNKKINQIYKKFENSLNLNESFAVAVSGGPDSLALAFLSKIYSLKKNIISKFFIAKHYGRTLSIKTSDDQYEGKLTSANEKFINIVWKVREPKPIGKGKITVEKSIDIDYNQIKEAKVKVKF